MKGVHHAGLRYIGIYLTRCNKARHIFYKMLFFVCRYQIEAETEYNLHLCDRKNAQQAGGRGSIGSILFI